MKKSGHIGNKLSQCRRATLSLDFEIIDKRAAEIRLWSTTKKKRKKERKKNLCSE